MSKTVLVLLNILYYVNCANILYVVPFASKSHYITLKPIGIELAKRGHNVTVITGYHTNFNHANYHQIKIDAKEIWEVLGGERPNVFTMTDISAEKFHEVILWGGGVAFTELVLNSTDVKNLLASDSSFDLVISEQFFQEATFALAHKYGTPLALVTTYGNCMRHNIVTRNPLQLATTISEFLDLKDPVSFWGRLRNFYFTWYEYVWWKYWYLEKQEELVRKYIPGLSEPVPSLYDLQKNTSLILLNSHFSFDAPIAYLPNIIEIGGMHLTHSLEKLPKDLQTILDQATDGVVYVNFGSNVRSSELPKEKKEAFIKVFSGLKQTVLWKWEDDSLNATSKNIVIREWFPQKEILSHRNIKVFISHGGLIGTQESVFNGIPIIGIPIYADQYNNLLQAEHLGIGKILKFHDINANALQTMLHDILYNVTYKNNAMEVSARFKDRPMTGLDTAMFWIEYVIRHKGANFMKSPGLEITWVAYNMFDVYAFLLALILMFVYLLFCFINFVQRLINRRSIYGKIKSQ